MSNFIDSTTSYVQSKWTKNLSYYDSLMIIASVCCLGAGILFILWWRKGYKNSGSIRNKNSLLTSTRRRRLLVISGCDSGLGLSMSKWAFDAGYSVLAGCLNCEGEGANILRSLNKNNDDNNQHEEGQKMMNSNYGQLFVRSLDVTKKESIQRFSEECMSILDENSFELYALIPNAAACCPGEFFWLTERQVQLQMDVCFWGAVNLTSVFQPLLLQYQSRVIVISSECTDSPLPGLAIYSAAKAALHTWAISFRLEVAKYGISVTCFQPGDFAGKSRLMCGQSQNEREMKAGMDKSLMDFYGDTFDAFNSHFINNFDENPPPIQPMENECIRRPLFNVLENDTSGTAIVRCKTNLGFTIFHLLIHYLPRQLSDSFILKVMNAPEWKKRPFVRTR